jgi:TfoX/Sxy family transcriptional regulator of competence genes
MRVDRARWDHFLTSLVSLVEQGDGTPFGATRSTPRKRSKPAEASVRPITTPDSSTAGHTFAKVIAALTRGDPDVQAPKPSRGEFGSNGLKVNGRIFAMLVRGALVLKLPQARVDAMVEHGAGTRFDAGKGSAMKEWVTVRGSEPQWLALAREARTFVAGRRGSR